MLTRMLADLHTHTLASDGQLSPADLLAGAAAAGVQLLAITDHDTLAGYRGLDATLASGCRIVPGVELSTTWRKLAIHVVGLNIDLHDATLLAGIGRQQQARSERAQLIAARLGKLGLHDTLTGAAQLAGSAGVSRAHFARYLVASGQCKSLHDAFRKYLGPGKAGDVRESWAALGEVIDWIHAAGGTAVLAHPAKYKLSNLKLEELARDFCAAGGDALEVISGQQDAALTTRLGKLAARHGLRASCGSDFHQPGQSWARLGGVAPLPPGCTPVWAGW
jgi:predicted metal-dependent phosphoesterase TrpH